MAKKVWRIIWDDCRKATKRGDGALRAALHRQALLAGGRAGFGPVPGVHHGVGAEAYARFTAPMREVVGVFVHKETWEKLGLVGPADAADDERLRDQVMSAADRSRQLQRRLDHDTNRLVLDQLFGDDVARSEPPGRRATVLGIDRKKTYVQLDDPPIDVKVYHRHLADRLGRNVEAGYDGVSLRAGRRHFLALGDAVTLRALGLDRGSDRWQLELLPANDPGRFARIGGRRMSQIVSSSLRDSLVFHGVFLAAGAGLLLADVGAVGARILFFGVAYAAALPLWARRRGHGEWIEIWRFLLPLSLLQVLPDAFLARVLGTLVFPDLGVPQVLDVSLFMAFLWLLPLFLCVHLGRRLEATGMPDGAVFWAVAAVSLALFAASEATLTLVPLWQPMGVRSAGPVALYVLPAEAFLGTTAWLAERMTRRAGVVVRLGSAVAVMVLYLGGLALGYLFLG